MIYNNILEQIGNTPMVKINNFNLKKGVEVFAKFEGSNPGGSIKDRIALKMIQEAIKNGKLTKKKTIIEPTSGNTGIGLAMIASILGYPIEIVMSEAVSVERRKMIEAFGAKIILTDGNLGTDGAIFKAREIVKKNPNRYFMPDQFSNKNNKLAHYEATAQEIWQDMGGKIDYFVSSIGTSGTIMGVSEYLKKLNPKVKIICAYPEKGHYIQGLKNMEEAIVPKLYDKNKIDEFITIPTEMAFEVVRMLAKKEGIFVGMSSGAAMLAVMEIAKKIDFGRVVVIFPDRGEKYLSTALFDKAKNESTNKIEILEIAKLKSHENIIPENFEKIKNSIIRDGHLINPIIVERDNQVILDGHHRVQALKSLGYKKIPAFVVDYYDKKIKVFQRRLEIPVSKKIIIEKAIKGEVFPYKTTKHLIPNRPRKINVLLDELR